MFNFKGLIDKYSSPLIIYEGTDGYRDWDNGGVWVEGGKRPVEVQGAIVPLNTEDLKFDDGGTYTTDDRKLYIHRNLDIGEEVKDAIDGKTYQVHREKDYSRFANGLNIYFLKRADNND
ncbi:hypothetical protein [Dethiothermospora halolimnae]|uniref:hypothetical protein n=1 Tax=Dethiothermospora halolimnae TaxID=3114390 RepID=UPI003CCBC553